MALMGMMQGAIVGELVLGGDGDGALLGAVGGAMLGSGMMGGGGGGGYGGGYNGGGGYYNNSGMGMAPPPMLMGCGRCYNSCACGRGGTTLVIQQQPPQAYQQQQQQQRQVIVQQAPQVVYKQSPPKVVYQAPPQPQAQPQQQYPPHPAGPPPELHAFYGAAADVTARVAQLVTYSILAEDATFAAAEDPCPALSKGLCVVYDAGAGALAVAGCAQGASLQLPPGARVKLALWGAFADVSDRVLGHARAPAFAVLASASFLQVADPAPGAQKFLLVHVLGAAGGGTVVRADDGQKLAVRWA